MSTIKFLLACKVPAVDVVSDNASSRSLVLVAPVFHSHSHCGYIRPGAGGGVGLDEVVEKSSLPSVCCSHYHHLHVVVRHTASVPGLQVADDASCWSIQQVRVQ